MYRFNSEFRQNKAHIEDLMYTTVSSFGIISNALVLSGPDYKRHVEQAFKHVARPYGGVQKAKVVLVENDSNMNGTFQHLVNERNSFPEGHLFHDKVELINDDVINVPSFRFEDMDLCATPKNTEYVLTERLRRQATLVNKDSYLKAFVFTWCERGFTRHKSFDFLRKLSSIVGAKLGGMNGASGKWHLRSRAKQMGKYLPTDITVSTTKGTWAYEHVPNFIHKGRVLKMQVFNYNGATEKAKRTAPMVTGIIVYV